MDLPIDAKQLTYIRKKLLMTQEEAAELIGECGLTIWQLYEDGTLDIPERTKIRILMALSEREKLINLTLKRGEKEDASIVLINESMERLVKEKCEKNDETTPYTKWSIESLAAEIYSMFLIEHLVIEDKRTTKQ